jgi:glycosyltransferase involved in cell wall biosynthesis
MKRVLMIAFYFPPRNNIACYRAGCFAKFLPEHGWLPTVVCQDWPAEGPDSDPDFVGRIPEAVEIHRIPAPEQRGFYRRVVLRKLAPYVWPHRAPILWWRQARLRVLSLLQRAPFDAIWATSDPLTPLALAAEAAAAAQLPWVADIRDCLNVQHFGSWYKRPLFRRQERLLCRRADRIVTVSEGLADALRGLSSRPVSVIPNGFDPSLLPEKKPTPASRFTILYAGTLVPRYQDPRPLFHALEICITRNQIPADAVEIQFLGADASRVRDCLSGLSNRLPVHVLRRVPHREAVAAQMSASVLLLLAHASERGIMTGKVFDYLAAGRPILAVPDDLETTSALLKQTGAGVALTEVEAIAGKLLEWYSAWKSDRSFNLPRHETEIAKYARPAQAGELAVLLGRLISHEWPTK